jgi:integrase
MARLIQKLTPLTVTRTTTPGYHGDGAGLWLQVSKTGSKSWIFRYTLAGRAREMGLGPVHTVTLPEARAKAKECRVVLLAGKDPLDVRHATRMAEALERAKMMTFDQCAAAYIDAHRSGWKNAKHSAQWQSTLNAYASPVIGTLPVADVDTSLIIKVLAPIWQDKTETAARLRGRIESVLDWATVSGYRAGDNPARWRGHLDKLLAAPSAVKKVGHHAALPWQEIGAFMAALRTREGVSARAVEFAILTAARSGEVRGATWQEIDLDAGLWVIPAERMKAKTEHRIPLASAARGLLATMPRAGALVFLGAVAGRPLSDMSLTAVLRRMDRGDITVHGFRSTFRDWCSESVANSFPREVCEHALAHSLPDKVEAAYRRGDLLDKRVVLMQAWADYCAVIPTAANVTPIRGVSSAA